MSNRERYIRQRAARLGLDPDAVVAIANVEGSSALHGGVSVGDHGTSFGPFQLHAGGALPKGKGSAWAHSNAGIDYALRQMSKVAGGLSGQQAVAAISGRFERPADVSGEIARAMGFYGKGSPGPVQGPGSPQSGSQAVTGGLSQQALRSMAAATLMDQSVATAQGRMPDSSGLMALAVARHQFQAAQDTYGDRARGGLSPKGAPRAVGSVKFIGNTQGENASFLNHLSAAAAAVGGTQIRVTSGYRDPKHNAAVGGVPRSNHTTGHAIDGDVFIPGHGWVPLGVALQSIAPKFGLRSGNVPGFYHGGLDPVHVDDGFNQH